jgi:hypothetical protein
MRHLAAGAGKFAKTVAKNAAMHYNIEVAIYLSTRTGIRQSFFEGTLAENEEIRFLL